jgi:pilus assembly protein FimV
MSDAWLYTLALLGSGIFIRYSPSYKHELNVTLNMSGHYFCHAMKPESRKVKGEKMFRKLSLALAVSAALSPMAVHALGLGNITAKSALNERFNAEIELFAVDRGELDTIKAGLASPLDFARAGIERPYLLSNLRFQPIVLDDGRMVIKIDTKDSIREPFLSFLIEVNWPKGRLIREYTVLLDPPVTSARKPPPIVAASVGDRWPADAAPGREPSAVRDEAAVDGSYRVRPGDTLWRIADRHRSGGASNEQMMIALFNANPQAFMRNSIHQLKAGAELMIPQPETVLGLPASMAREEFLAAAQGAPSAQPVTFESAPEQRLQIATVRSQAFNAASSEAATPAEGEIEQVKSDLLVVRETSESTRQETDELRSRIRELEAQLSDIRQLLKLKSNELAQMQAGGRAATGQPAPTPTEPVLKAEGELEVEAVPYEQAGIIEAPEGADTALVNPEAEQPQVAPPLAVAEPSKPQPTRSAPVEPPVAASQPVGLIDRILSNSILLGIVGGVVVVLLSLVWLLIRRRREAEDEYHNPDEQELEASAVEFTKDLAETQAKAADKASDHKKTDETSFITDFSPSDVDSLQDDTGEVDPAAEADVYIAYGRYQQAESLVNQAIEKSPDRLDLQFKLLEIYFTTRNVSAFTRLAERLHGKGAEQSDPKLWQRVQAMGKELAPGHDLFHGVAAAATAAVIGAVGTEQSTTQELAAVSGDLADLSLDLESGYSDFSDQPSNISGLDDGSVIEPSGFDLGLQEKSASANELDDATLPGDKSDMLDSELELNLDLDDLGSLEDIDLGDLGFNDDQQSAAEVLTGETQTPVAPAKLDDYPSTGGLSGFEEEDEIPSISLDDLEFDTDELDTGAEGEALSDLLTGSDGNEQVETKLDLARAYIEMGDGDGAREILNEVMTEGSDAQKLEAKDLIGQIT